MGWYGYRFRVGLSRAVSRIIKTDVMLETVKEKKLPTLWYERRLWNKGYGALVGLDEVGRGAWAGPLVVGGVIVNSNCDKRHWERLGVDDSKRLSAKARAVLAEVIKREAYAWTVVEISASIINRIGMGKAVQMGFRKAVRAIGGADFALIDAFYVHRVAGLPWKKRQLPIVRGDQKSISIAAASIIAKVHRDNLMYKLSDRYTMYGWSKNVGYGTLGHLRAIEKWGVTRWHRKQFVATGYKNFRGNRERF